MSTRLVYCQKLHKEAEGLTRPPFPGELGKRIYDHISKEAWEQWVKRQTMFINENRLNVTEQSARDFLKKEMERFLFEGEDNKPEGYVEPGKENN